MTGSGHTGDPIDVFKCGFHSTHDSVERVEDMEQIADPVIVRALIDTEKIALASELKYHVLRVLGIEFPESEDKFGDF